MGQLKIDQAKQADSVVLELFGDIDEDADFTKVSFAGIREAILDLGNVKFINSVGVRAWLHWMKSVPKDVKFVFRKCPSIIIDQINMIHGFFPAGARMASFYVPYYCEPCDMLTQVLANEGVEFKGGSAQVPQSAPCTKCKKPAEIDTMEAQYLAFLSQTKG